MHTHHVDNVNEQSKSLSERADVLLRDVERSIWAQIKAAATLRNLTASEFVQQSAGNEAMRVIQNHGKAA